MIEIRSENHVPLKSKDYKAREHLNYTSETLSLHLRELWGKRKNSQAKKALLDDKRKKYCELNVFNKKNKGKNENPIQFH